MNWQSKLVELSKKYGSAAKFAATTILSVIPGGSSFSPIIEKLFDTAQQTAQDNWEQIIAQQMQLSAENLSNLNQVLDILSGDLQHVMAQMAGLQQMSDLAIRQLKIAQANDERCRAAFSKLDAVIQRFDRLEQQNIQLLAGQHLGNGMIEETLAIVRELSSKSPHEAVQKYFHQMTDLMLNHRLCDAQPSDKVVDSAREMTLGILACGRLDGTLKGELVKFLVRSSLLQDKDKRIIKLKGADLCGVDLRKADLRVRRRDTQVTENDVGNGISLRGADLGRANLREAILIQVYLREATLAEADMTAANLGAADLRGADMNRAILQGAKLGGADLRRANLRNANLRDAKLGDADLEKANLAGANLSGVDLRHVKNATPEQLSPAIGADQVKLRRDFTPPSS